MARGALRVWVAGFFAVATLVATFPLILHLPDAVPVDLGDPLLNAWILAWDAHALTTDPLHFFDANIFYPFPQPLTYSDALLSGALLVAPVMLVTHNAVLACNVLLLLSLWLAGFGSYLLVRDLTRHELAAVVAGCLFAFCPYVRAQFAHVQLLQIGWLPLALLFLRRAFRGGGSRDVVLFAACCVCLALASFYLMYLGAVAIGTFLVVEAWANRVGPRVQAGAWVRLVGALALVGLCVIPFGLPYARTQQLFHFQWPVQLIRDLSATWIDFASVLPGHSVYGTVLGRSLQTDWPAEHALFPGLAVLVLALVAVVRLNSMCREDRRELVCYVAMGVVALVLSFGPMARLTRLAEAVPVPYALVDRLVPGFGEAVPMPYALLDRLVPGFAALRVPARFELVLILALAVMAGFGVKALDTVWARTVSSGLRRVFLTGVAAAALLELVPGPTTLHPIETGATVPPVYAWLAAQDPKTVVAEIPATPAAAFRYVYFSTYHWHPLVNGTSGLTPPESEQLSALLDAFPDSIAVESLESLGVRYVVAHRDALDERTDRALDDIGGAGSRLSVAGSFGSDVVYEIPPVDGMTSLQGHARLELPAVVARGLTPSAVLSVTNDTAHPMSGGVPPVSKAEVTVDDAASASTLGLPVLVQPGARVTRAIPLTIDALSGATGEARVRVHVTGRVDLEAYRTVQTRDMETSAQGTGALRASVLRVTLPPVTRTHRTIQIDVVTRNIGQAVWLADNGGTTGAVGAAIRGWYTADGQPAPVNYGTAAHLDWNVSPGQEASFTILASSPNEPGRYDLVLDLVSEGITWFDDVGGGARTVVPVTVDS
jgi:hypothetical protein